MEVVQVLFSGSSADALEKLQNSLPDVDYETRVVRSCSEATAALRTVPSAVFVIANDDDSVSVDCCLRIRKEFFSKPIQIFFIGENRASHKLAAASDTDDFGARPINTDEFIFRIRAAAIRLKSQERLLQERDFFRNAAKQEEELSSRILDQHVILKEAFQNIEVLNKELEDTNRKLEQVARFDILSGLYNRMSLFSAMEVEIERTLRTKTPLSGIMIDIDNFKDINDHFGHIYGDEVIAEIGRRLVEHLRKYDQAGRYGGEEFYIVLPNTNLHQAYIIAERFRENLAETPVVVEATAIPITASFGIAEFRAGETRENWIARSDRNMYVAKQSGRNRVVAE